VSYCIVSVGQLMDSVQYASNCVIKIWIPRCRRSWFKFTIVAAHLCVRREILSYFNNLKIILKLYIIFRFFKCQIIIIVNYYYREMKNWSHKHLQYRGVDISVSFKKLCIFNLMFIVLDKFKICLCNFVSRFLCAWLPLQVHV